MNFMLGEGEVDASSSPNKNPIDVVNNRGHGTEGAQPELRIAVASTFTADLVQRPLRFWMKQLDIAAEITLAPYAQILQELLNPASVLSNNRRGVNVLLIRIEDWMRERSGYEIESNIAHLRTVAGEFVAALDLFCASTSSPLFLIVTPASEGVSVYHEAIEEIERTVVRRQGIAPNLHCWTYADIERLYPVSRCQDPRSDAAAHIPYTDEYFVATTTLIARRVAALFKTRFKVIAIDCDNTLWRGICGEDDVSGIELTPAHTAFQSLLVRLHDAGVLLCLCTKNNPADVDAVFTQRADMRLKEEHIVASRVNWEAKSSNLKSLAEELGLALDSFIMVDDSAMEIAEVRAHCPTVLTLQFPQSSEDIAHFLNHTWAFDYVGVTEDAKQRTQQYKQNRQRRAAQNDAGSLGNFLESLQLVVDVTDFTQADLSRVAELLQRTNQFNLTGIRRRATEIEEIWRSGARKIVVIRVRDRFGDYGLVGALFFSLYATILDIETFVLSCRVLGRGVEHRAMNELGRIAAKAGASTILLRYRRLPRNEPAWLWLEKSFARFESPHPKLHDEMHFSVPSDYAQSLEVSGAAGGAVEKHNVTSAEKPGAAVVSTRWHEIAYRLSRVADIIGEIDRVSAERPRRPGEYVAPRSPLEAALTDIWAEVMRLEKVGIRDNFFEIGGDSLLAVQTVARIGSVLGLELPLGEIFDAPTVEEVAARLANASEAGPSIQPMARTSRVPLSLSQQRLWFIEQLEGADASAAYRIRVQVRLQGMLDREALKSALNTVVERHEALRTVFVMHDGEPSQLIAAQGEFPLEFADLSKVPDGEREVLRYEVLELATVFDLATGPLIRGRLLQLAPDVHVLLITMHHIITDGWSIGVLFRELAALYESVVARRPSPLAALTIQYADYAIWQRDWSCHPIQRAQLAYWKDQLQGAPELLELPLDRPRPTVQSYRGGNVDVALDAPLVSQLREFSLKQNVTLAMTLATAWAIVLARLSGQYDLVLGIPVANRRRAELEGLIGFFVNTLAVRVRLDGDPSVAEMLQRTRRIMLGAYAHQDVPFEQVVEAVQPVRTLSHSPIFQVMFTLQNTPGQKVGLSGVSVSWEELQPDAAKFDLLLWLQEFTDGVYGTLNYAADLFDRHTIERWVTCLKEVLSGLVEQPEQKITRLPLLTRRERNEVVELFNAQLASKPQTKLVHQLFEEQAERTPNAIAVVYETAYLGYQDLNGKANQLARYLVDKGIGPDQLVGLCVERGIEMVIGVLGILKAGGAYLPLDPDYPTERLRYMLDDAKPKLLVTQSQLRRHLPQTSAEIVEIDSTWDEIARWPSENLANGLLCSRLDQLAYVIYTSGSTGEPKGVMIEHRNITRLLAATDHWFHFNEQDVWTLFHSIAFDFSVWELWGALLYGGRVVVVPYLTARSAGDFYHLLCKEGVTVLNQTPSAFAQLIDAQVQNPGRKHSLRVVIFGGEALEPRMLRPWIEVNGSDCPKLVNMYGITETTVHVTYQVLSEEEIRGDCGSLIGKPIPDLQVYVLDPHREPVPVGVPGEIYVGGGGVARGYLRRPELTVERFVPNLFSSRSHARLYKSGDLARWLPNGSLEYLGRNDHQVKVRGFRIELGEIEAQLVRHGQVKDAVVVARQDVPGEKRLVAYLVLKEPSVGASSSFLEQLRLQLRAAMPAYMVPSALVVVERFSLTSNGKLDRRALPAPDLSAFVHQTYESPQGEMEEALARIWQELLHVKRVGREDNFFELGGHSLLIVRMMEQLRHAGLYTEVRRVFESPTLAALAGGLTPYAAAQIDIPPNLIPADATAITPQMLTLVDLASDEIERIVRSVDGGAANIQDIYPLAPLQEGILFHHLLNAQDGDTYVVPTLLAVESRTRVDDLIAALQSVIDRHDAFRTAIFWEDLPRPVQVVYRRAVLPVEEISLNPQADTNSQIEQTLRLEQQIVDLRQAPPMRVLVAADPQSSQYYVLLKLHHIVGDNSSREIVMSELIAHLEGRAQGLPRPLPYRDHVAQSLAYMRGHDAETFFRHKLADVDEPTAPFGLLDVHGDGRTPAEAFKTLEQEVGRRLRAQARLLSVNVATLFHAAWGVVVAHTSGRDDVVFGSVLLGRLQSSAGAKRIVGMFINTLPLRLQLRGRTVKELIKQTQGELVELLGHEQASLVSAQRCSGLSGGTPLFSALLNYRHSPSNPEANWNNASGIRVLRTQEFTNFPISMSVDDLGNEFTLTAQSDRRVDPHRLNDYFEIALNSLADSLEFAPQTPALALSILSPAERHELIEELNATERQFPSDLLIHELFEEQVRRTPKSTAVLSETQSLTFAQLNARANRLARHLRQQGVGPDQVVAVCVERSIDMVISLLGVLKAGGAYLPLDPAYPAQRLAYIIEDAAPCMLLTQKHLRNVLPRFAGKVLAIDGDRNAISEFEETNVPPEVLGLTPRHLAYVIYTSGSTGMPKGVMNEHRGMVNRIHAQKDIERFSESDVCSQKTSISFVDAVFETFGPLCSGQPLVIIPASTVSDTLDMSSLIAKEKITQLVTVPSLARSMLDDSQTVHNLSGLRIWTLSGEEVPADLVEKLQLLLPTCEIIIQYGSSEVSSDAAIYKCTRSEGERIPIGRPLANVEIYILDESGELAPRGVVGEICVGGVGVARGYLNRPQLTAEFFIPDPFSSQPDARLYKTGDLGRWRPDGLLECLGRKDHQVKIRGFRIELGEIETQLMRHPHVRQAVVVAREDVQGEKRLVAYVVPQDKAAHRTRLSVQTLRAHLQAVLPEYMMPSAFVMLERFPLTPNGKLDRRSLPAPQLYAYVSRDYEVPQGEVEEAVAEIWRELLQVERVGRQDSFFELGGHSLLATRMFSRIRRQLKIGVPIKILFDAPTLERFANAIQSERDRQMQQESLHMDTLAQEFRRDVDEMHDEAVLARIAELEKELRA